MKKLRIHKMLYVNQGTANINLKGVTEYHAIFKFDTDEEAADFIRKVKEWNCATERVCEIKKSDGAEAFDRLNEELDKLKKQRYGQISWDKNKEPNDLHSEETKEKITKSLVNAAKNRNKDEVKTTVKKPASKKRKAGRPAKADIQG